MTAELPEHGKDPRKRQEEALKIDHGDVAHSSVQRRIVRAMKTLRPQNKGLTCLCFRSYFTQGAVVRQFLSVEGKFLYDQTTNRLASLGFYPRLLYKK